MSAKSAVDYSVPGMLHQILSSEDYALALTPGFYRFYAHIGVLQALEERGCLRPSHVSGSSAGALVGGFLASGMSPTQMMKAVLEIKRADIWDVGGVGGLLKGELFQELIERNLPVKTFEECPLPLGVTTFDLGNMKTQHITKGHLATAMRASCTFPGMFQPVKIGGTHHIDGGVFDGIGLMALPHALGLDNNTIACDSPLCAPVVGEDQATSSTETATSAGAKSVNAVRKGKMSDKTRNSTAAKSSLQRIRSNSLLGIGNSSSTVLSLVETERAIQMHMFSQLVVNIVFGRSSIASSVLPPELSKRKLLTIVVESVPMVHPFNMDTHGIVAYRVARAATLKALHSTHMQELAPHHWCCYVDAHGINPDDFPAPIAPSPVDAALGREALRTKLLRRSGSDQSSADSVAMENTWKTQSSRRGGKRKLPASSEQEQAASPSKRADTRARSPRASTANAVRAGGRPADGNGDTRSVSGSDSGSEESSEEESGSDSGSGSEVEEEENTRGARKGFMSIPSFSFLNGTYRMYHDAYSTTLHTIEDASSAVTNTLHSMEATGSAILNDASTAISSAKKRLNDAVRSSFETVVGELTATDDADASDGSDAPSEEEREATKPRGRKASKQAPASLRASSAPRRKSVRSAEGPTTPEAPARRSTRAAASAVKSANKGSAGATGRKSK